MILRGLLLAAACLLGGSWALEQVGAAPRPVHEMVPHQESRAPEAPASPVPTEPREWTDEIERDFALRSIGHLQISNLRGEVSVQGWALDKIRVKARRRVMATTEAEAKTMLAAVDFRYREFDGDIELAAEYGKNLSIEERLRERKNPRTSMDFIVFAPANLRLRVWSVAGQALVRSWRSSAEVRTQSGQIRIEDLRGESLTLACPQCPVSVESVQAALRCMAGTGEVRVKELKGKRVYVETTSGSQTYDSIQGEQLYLSKSGEIHGRRLKGDIQFHTDQGRVQLLESEGFVSGRTESAPVSVQMLQWKFSDRALIESVRGEIQVTLPASFSGEVDLWSVFGRVKQAFSLTPLDDVPVYGPEPANHLRGRIAGGSDQLKIYSQYGGIQLLKGL